MGNTIYILNHYTAGVILFGARSQLRRHGLSKVMCIFMTTTYLHLLEPRLCLEFEMADLDVYSLYYNSLGFICFMN